MKTICCITLLFNSIALGQWIKDIATVEGVRSVQLKGIGIVAGLSGTGDSRKNIELQDKLQKILRFWGGGGNVIDTQNVALVLVTANVPSYVKPGQSFPVHVASIGNAKDLTGGFLLECALRGPITPAPANSGEEVSFTDYAIAQGQVIVQPEAMVKTTGRCTAILERDFGISFHTNYEYITLLLNQPDFNTANNIAKSINYAAQFEGILGSVSNIAHAVDAGSVHVRIPARVLKEKRLVDFVSIILSQVQLVDREPRVLVNAKENTILTNGKVLVRPFIGVVDGARFQIPPPFQPGRKAPAVQEFRLLDVIADLQDKRVPPQTIIKCIIAMNRAGVLEGKLIEEGK